MISGEGNGFVSGHGVARDEEPRVPRNAKVVPSGEHRVVICGMVVVIAGSRILTSIAFRGEFALIQIVFREGITIAVQVHSQAHCSILKGIGVFCPAPVGVGIGVRVVAELGVAFCFRNARLGGVCSIEVACVWVRAAHQVNAGDAQVHGDVSLLGFGCVGVELDVAVFGFSPVGFKDTHFVIALHRISVDLNLLSFLVHIGAASCTLGFVTFGPFGIANGQLSLGGLGVIVQGNGEGVTDLHVELGHFTLRQGAKPEGQFV